MTKLVAAGYVVHDGHRLGGGVAAIWGHGPTAEVAEANFRQVMATAQVTILGPGEQLTDRAQNFTHSASYRTIPATAALLALVEAMGGAIAWRVVDGIACPVAEGGDAGRKLAHISGETSRTALPVLLRPARAYIRCRPLFRRRLC
jgi:hypothetical protein